MKVLFAASEAAPFVKTDGLAEFAGCLPAAIHRLGADIRVVLPLYEDIAPLWRGKMKLIESGSVALSWRQVYCGVYMLEKDGMIFYFIDNEYYYKRKGLYGHYDDGERFSFFSRAVAELMIRLDWRPEIVHLNDWQTALVPIYIKELEGGFPVLSGSKTVFTIHNIEYQGRFSKDILRDVCGISEGWYNNGILEFMDNVSLLKGAILTADHVTTVSPTYAEEITYPFYARGLESAISSVSDHFNGILCGIEQDRYDPGNDPLIRCRYTSSSIDLKKVNKRFLQRKQRLDESEEAVIVAFIGKLVSNSGIDLMISAFEDLMKLDLQFIVLGTGDYDYEKFFKEAEKRFPGRVSANIADSDELERRIYAGADILLLPFRKEPCGRNQMIAMRYGMLPAVRETGGLRDTVKPYDPDTGEGNGFSFSDYNADDMFRTISDAVRLRKEKPAHWERMAKSNMETDLSWKRPALEYMKIYEGLLKDR